MPKIRAFIAVDISPELRAELERTISSLRSDLGGVKWLKPENIHLTLKFLGETDREKIEAIGELLEETARRHSPFTIEVGDLGAFPEMKRPRVIWLGVERRRELIALAGDIEERLEGFGFEKEKRAFRPHLTLGRVKVPPDSSKLADAFRRIGAVSFVSLDVKMILLLQSTLTPHGAVYQVLSRHRLA